MITRSKIGIRLAVRPKHLPLLAVRLPEIRLRIDEDPFDVESHRNAAGRDFVDGATKVFQATEIIPGLIVSAAAVHRVPAPVEEVEVIHTAKGLGVRGHDLLELDGLARFVEHAAAGR